MSSISHGNSPDRRYAKHGWNTYIIGEKLNHVHPVHGGLRPAGSSNASPSVRVTRSKTKLEMEKRSNEYGDEEEKVKEEVGDMRKMDKF